VGSGEGADVGAGEGADVGWDVVGSSVIGGGEGKEVGAGEGADVGWDVVGSSVIGGGEGKEVGALVGWDVVGTSVIGGDEGADVGWDVVGTAPHSYEVSSPSRGLLEVQNSPCGHRSSVPQISLGLVQSASLPVAPESGASWQVSPGVPKATPVWVYGRALATLLCWR